jgi:hypothetical protein
MSDDIQSLRQRLNTSVAQPAGARGPKVQESFLARLWRKPPAWVRRHERFPCCVLASVDILGKDVSIEGLVTELSQGGLLFRPASSYVFDRTGSDITVRFEDDELAGRIVNVKGAGYGVRFDDDIELDRVKALVEQFGFAAAA